MAAETLPLPLDLSDLGAESLKALREGIDARLTALEAQRREEGFKELEEVAERCGFTKAEVAAHFRGRRSRKPKNPPRYRNPCDLSQSWTGAGRQPAWVKAHLAGGGSLQELEICSREAKAAPEHTAT